MKDVDLYWFVGLFEGEGSFNFRGSRPHALVIQMTDLDVLERVQKLVGGKIYTVKKRKAHWKQSWIWVLNGAKSLEVARQMRPLLLSRRAQRCEEYIAGHRTAAEVLSIRATKALSNKEKAFSLRETGATHKEIANTLGLNRAYVSHLLGKRYAHR